MKKLYKRVIGIATALILLMFGLRLLAVWAPGLLEEYGRLQTISVVVISLVVLLHWSILAIVWGFKK